MADNELPASEHDDRGAGPATKTDPVVQSSTGRPVRKGQDPATAADHHTAGFLIDESGLTLGVQTLATLAADYLALKR